MGPKKYYCKVSYVYLHTYKAIYKYSNHPLKNSREALEGIKLFFWPSHIMKPEKTCYVAFISNMLNSCLWLITLHRGRCHNQAAGLSQLKVM